MSRLTPVKRTEFIKRLKKAGFNGPYVGGKHFFMIKDDIRLTLPNPHKKEIGVYFLEYLNKGPIFYPLKELNFF